MDIKYLVWLQGKKKPTLPAMDIRMWIDAGYSKLLKELDADATGTK